MSDQCPFCAIARGEVDVDLIAFRNSVAFVIPALKQRASNPGQFLVCPVAHDTSFHRADTHLRNELMHVVSLVAKAALDAFGALGSTVLLNDNAPDQTLRHIHIHIIPRFERDRLLIPNPDETAAPRDLRLELAVKLRSALG